VNNNLNISDSVLLRRVGKFYYLGSLDLRQAGSHHQSPAA